MSASVKFQTAQVREEQEEPAAAGAEAAQGQEEAPDVRRWLDGRAGRGRLGAFFFQASAQGANPSLSRTSRTWISWLGSPILSPGGRKERRIRNTPEVVALYYASWCSDRHSRTLPLREVEMLRFLHRAREQAGHHSLLARNEAACGVRHSRPAARWADC